MLIEIKNWKICVLWNSSICISGLDCSFFQNTVLYSFRRIFLFHQANKLLRVSGQPHAFISRLFIWVWNGVVQNVNLLTINVFHKQLNFHMFFFFNGVLSRCLHFFVYQTESFCTEFARFVLSVVTNINITLNLLSLRVYEGALNLQGVKLPARSFILSLYRIFWI